VDTFSCLAGLLASVEAAECVGEHERHEQDARSEDQHMLGLAQIEVAYAADQKVSQAQIEEAPKDIDRRGGQALARRRCEGALKGMSRDSVAEMRQCICEERSPKKVCKVMIPAHGNLHSDCKTMLAGSRFAPG